MFPNANNNLIPMRLVTGWRVCIDYKKMNTSIEKDHFPMSFIDQMLDQLARKWWCYFLDVYSGYNQILSHLKINRRQLLHVPMVHLLSKGCLLDYVIRLVPSKDA